MSRPTLGRGLKFIFIYRHKIRDGVAPHWGVDWNLLTFACLVKCFQESPHTGAWIEMSNHWYSDSNCERVAPHWGVDWNCFNIFYCGCIIRSRPTLGRGLKYLLSQRTKKPSWVAPHWGVDWNHSQNNGTAQLYRVAPHWGVDWNGIWERLCIHNAASRPTQGRGLKF